MMREHDRIVADIQRVNQQLREAAMERRQQQEQLAAKQAKQTKASKTSPPPPTTETKQMALRGRRKSFAEAMYPEQYRADATKMEQEEARRKQVLGRAAKHVGPMLGNAWAMQGTVAAQAAKRARSKARASAAKARARW
jgi:hypothetical protein